MKGPKRTLKIGHAAIIATSLVLMAGIAMISPLFFRLEKTRAIEPEHIVMLTFSVTKSDGASEWCRELSSLLERETIGAAVFFSGKVAGQNPQAVSSFSAKVDIGSRTYDNVDLTGISDYSFKLDEIADGKAAVDSAGNLTSGIFQAPSGAADDDIYSLLNRSGIMADFSYKDHYNLNNHGDFYQHEAVTCEGHAYAPDIFAALPDATVPLIIVFDDTYSISCIEDVIARLKKSNVEFCNASALTGLALTRRQ